MALIKPLSSFFIKITAFIAVILLCVHFLLLQSTPTVIVSSAQQVDHAQSVNALLYDVSKLLKERKIGHNLTITQAQGQSLLGFLQRALPAFNGNVEFSRSGGILNVSYHVKYWFVPRYLNLQLHLITSKRFMGIFSAFKEIRRYNIEMKTFEKMLKKQNTAYFALTPMLNGRKAMQLMELRFS